MHTCEDLGGFGSLDTIDLREFAAREAAETAQALRGGHDFDLVIIGSGPAGQKAAISGAKAGARVALVERDPLAGGVCLNTGTIPSKTLREAVLYLTGYRQRGFYGSDYRVKDHITPDDLLDRTASVIQQERDVINFGLASNGVVRLVGTGKVTGPNEVDVASGIPGAEPMRVTGRRIIVCAGTRPRRPADVPFDGVTVFDSDAVFGASNQMRPLPDSIIVLGAGVIGIEYASMYAALGIPTILVDGRPDPLSFVDNGVSNLLYAILERNGVTMHFGRKPGAITILGTPGDHRSRVRLALDDDAVEADELLFAQGREPVTDELGLAQLGVKLTGRGQVAVDADFRTSVPTIFAAGDIIGFPSLASTSAEQGRVAALRALGHDVTWRPDTLPYGIYTIPEISMVGKTEEDLQRDGHAYVVGIGLWKETARGHILGDTTGALKLIFSRDDRRLIGVHAIGEGATELLHIGQCVMHYGGGPEYFTDTVFNYPTLAEVYKIAAWNALNRLRGVALSTRPLIDEVFEGRPPDARLQAPL